MPPVPSAQWPGILLAVMLWAAASLAAQAPIPRPLNGFTPDEEVELGREAADAVLDRVSPVKDSEIVRFVAQIGRRLSDAIPAELRHAEFQYEIGVLNLREVTSFALPGGPVFMSVRLIEVAPDEDALAGLLAHEMAHVVLRHATTQLSGNEQYQIGAISGRQIGLTAAVPSPGVLERGASFSIASYFLRFDPVHEAAADLLATQLAKTAGYDPLAVHDMFRELRTTAAAHGGLEWLLRHPSPRTDARVRSVRVPSAGFQSVRARAGSMPLPEDGGDHPHWADTPVVTIGSRVLPPQGDFRSVTAGDQLQLRVPANWRRLLAGNTVIFSPERAHLNLRDGPVAVTHGLQVGIARSVTGELEGDISALLSALARRNPKLIWVPAFQRMRVAGRDALTTTMTNVSPVTREFEMVIATALRLSDDSFLYFLGLAPHGEFSTYRGAFDRVVDSLILAE